MINVFIDYPVPHATIHRNQNCGFIHRNREGNFIRREEEISLSTLSSVLQKFDKEEVRFAPSAGLNSIWLKIDLADELFEIAVVNHILKVLSRRYTPFTDVVPKISC